MSGQSRCPLVSAATTGFDDLRYPGPSEVASWGNSLPADPFAEVAGTPDLLSSAIPDVASNGSGDHGDSPIEEGA